MSGLDRVGGFIGTEKENLRPDVPGMRLTGMLTKVNK